LGPSRGSEHGPKHVVRERARFCPTAVELATDLKPDFKRGARGAISFECTRLHHGCLELGLERTCTLARSGAKKRHSRDSDAHSPLVHVWGTRFGQYLRVRPFSCCARTSDVETTAREASDGGFWRFFSFTTAVSCGVGTDLRRYAVGSTVSPYLSTCPSIQPDARPPEVGECGVRGVSKLSVRVWYAHGLSKRVVPHFGPDFGSGGPRVACVGHHRGGSRNL
jgi:hypothetical protein